MNGPNLMVVQGGGPTQVLNATLAAIIDEARAGHSFARVLGARGGTKGLVENNIVDLGRLTTSELERLRMSPGGALGSSRFKPTAGELDRIVENLEQLNVRYLLFVGGNGTMRCRCEKPGLLGRCSWLHVSEQDWKDADLIGRAGVRGLLEGRSGEMAALLPLGSKESSGYRFVPMKDVAGVDREIPAEWIGEGPIPVRAGFVEYLRPLAGELVSYHAPLSSDLNFYGELQHATARR